MSRGGPSAAARLLRWVAHCLGAGLSPTRLLRDEPTVIHDALAPSLSARGVGG